MACEQISVAGIQILDGENCKLEKLGTAPGVLSGIVDIRYLEEVRRTYPYLSDRNGDMYCAGER